MSAVDPFATTGDDPFADPAPAQSTQAETPAAPQRPVAPPEPTPPAPTPEPTPPTPPADVPAAPAEPTAADLEPQTPPEPGEPPVVNREGQPVAPSEPPQAPAAPPEAPPATPTPDPAASNGTQAAADADAPEDPNAPKKGFRHYVVLYQTGPGQFTVAPLKDKHGKEGMDFVRRLTEPAEKEGDADVVNFYLEARNNDHAYRLCFTLFNRPADGVTVLPLPKASWRPRRVAPAPPAPERERLSIS